MNGKQFNAKFPDGIFAIFSNSPKLDASDYHEFTHVQTYFISTNEYIYIVKVPDCKSIDVIETSVFDDYRYFAVNFYCPEIIIDPPIHRDNFEIIGDNNALFCVKYMDAKLLKYVKYKTHEICLVAVQRHGCALEFVEEQTPGLAQICLAAVQSYGLALKFVKEQTPEICLAAVQNNWRALQIVKEQTLEICLAAVRKNGLALQYVKEQTPELCLAAVKNQGLVLEFVKEQTPEICLEAVQQNRNAIKYVDDKFKSLIK